MSDSQPSKVFLFDNSDPEMQRAYENARASFGHFWREVNWERRRIVPALDVACVKAPFSDGPNAPRAEGTPNAEHMWISDVDFDGRFVSGVLLNAPNWLKTVKEGHSARIPLGEISDWMYVISGEVFGAHTVNLLRSRMGRQERQEHDDAWGLKFGDPRTIRVVPEQNKGRRIAQKLVRQTTGGHRRTPDERKHGYFPEGAAHEQPDPRVRERRQGLDVPAPGSAGGKRRHRKSPAGRRRRRERVGRSRNDAVATCDVARLGQSSRAPGGQRRKVTTPDTGAAAEACYFVLFASARSFSNTFSLPPKKPS